MCNTCMRQVIELRLCTYVYVCSLDLDKWINEPPEEEDDKKNDINFFLGPSSSSSSKYEDNPVSEDM